MQGYMTEQQPSFKPVAVTITIENAKELAVLQAFMRCDLSIPDYYCDMGNKKKDSEDHRIISNFMEIFSNLIHNV